MQLVGLGRWKPVATLDQVAESSPPEASVKFEDSIELSKKPGMIIAHHLVEAKE